MGTRRPWALRLRRAGRASAIAILVITNLALLLVMAGVFIASVIAVRLLVPRATAPRPDPVVVAPRRGVGGLARVRVR